MDSHRALGAALAAALLIALPASADARPHRVSEKTAQHLESIVLGSSHARAHAFERRQVRRAARRMAGLSQAGRARLRRAERLSLHAASTAPASEVGSWEAPFQLPVHAIHTAVLPTGKIMIWSYPLVPLNGGTRLLETHAYLWDPTMGTGADAWKEASPPADEHSPHSMIFCGGGSLLANGTLLTTGGTLYWPNKDRPGWAGIKDVWTFDPWDEVWTRQPDTAQGRWYPTQTELPDGRTLILGGYDEGGDEVVDPDLEVFTPSEDPHGVGRIDLYESGELKAGIYPHLFTMPNGQVLLAGPRSIDSALLTVTEKGPDGEPRDVFEWTDVPNSNWRTLGTAFLEPGPPSGSSRVTLAGGINPGATDEEAGVTPARDTTQTIDGAHPDDGWEYGHPMQIARSNFNTVVLPDNTVVAVGGSNGTNTTTGLFTGWDDNRGRQIDIRDPHTGEWRLGPAQQEDRAYHSTAVLLPDGRVLSGGDDRSSTRDHDTGEIYSPPYLHRGPRPLIGAAPQEMGYGRAFRIGRGGPRPTRAVLMAPGVTTHGTEMQARSVELEVTKVDASGVDTIGPPSSSVAPPGWYMLFLLTDDGVPSVARWVHVDGPPAPPRVDPPVQKPRFGTATRVAVGNDRLWLRGNRVIVPVRNANAFAVGLRASVRLIGKRVHGAAREPVTVERTLPGSAVRHVVVRLGSERARQIRKLGKVRAKVKLVVSDPSGGTRTVKRPVTLLATHR